MFILNLIVFILFKLIIYLSACQAERPQVISAQNGTVSTPNWPADYENDLICEWKFEAEPGNVSTRVLSFQ